MRLNQKVFAVASKSRPFWKIHVKRRLWYSSRHDLPIFRGTVAHRKRKIFLVRLICHKKVVSRSDCRKYGFVVAGGHYLINYYVAFCKFWCFIFCATPNINEVIKYFRLCSKTERRLFLELLVRILRAIVYINHPQVTSTTLALIYHRISYLWTLVKIITPLICIWTYLEQ